MTVHVIRYKMLLVFSTIGLITILIITSGAGTGLGDLVTAAIPVGEFPQALIFNPSNNDTYVSNRDSGTVSVIDSTSNSVIKNIQWAVPQDSYYLTHLITTFT